MNLHDWTRVEASTFHDFHTAWIGQLRNSLNRLLPPPYYAQAEQHMGRFVPDVLALHSGDPVDFSPRQPESENGNVAVLPAPPQARIVQNIDLSKRALPRTLTIRHTSGHRIIALLEIVSPGNKETENGIQEFVRKIETALRAKIHVTILDLFPSGKFDPDGIHARILNCFVGDEYQPPTDKPLTFVAYSSGNELKAHIEPMAVLDPLPRMPLFLTEAYYLPLPLPETYSESVEGMPRFWRQVLEGNTVQ